MSTATTTNIFESYRKDAKIYYYGGHGSDVCNPRTRLPITRLVPDNCIYVTIAECGYSTFLEGSEENFFRNPASEKVLRHIDLSNNKTILARKMKRKQDWVHVHMPGTPYVVSHFSPLLFWNDVKESTGMGLSGLIEKKKFEALGTKGYVDSSTPPSFHFPKRGKEILAEVEKSGRSPYKYYKAVEMMKSFLNPGETDYLEKRFMTQDVNKILTETNYVLTKDKLLEFYEASIYPTQEEMRIFLDTKFPHKSIFFPSDLTELEEYIGTVMNPENKDEVEAEFPLSNTYIMKYFPGIHIYGICRVVHDCQIGLQRTMSGVQEMQRQGKIYRFPRTQPFESLQSQIHFLAEEEGKTQKQRSTALKRFLSDKATNLYLLSQEEKQTLYDYLLGKQYLIENATSTSTSTSSADNSINSTIMKYYLMPEKYRLKIGAGRVNTESPQNSSLLSRMPRPSQHSLAISALLSRDTSNFNRYYGKEAISPTSRPSSPMFITRPRSRGSQYNLAISALESKSPKNFNNKYGISQRRRKTRRHRKARRATRKN